MADIGTALSLELSRILDCPYPASLSGLADLLGYADAVTIQACIYNRPPCAVSRLAVLICEALPLWAYALRVLQYLCQVPEFRHELLLQKPEFLDSLLSKAISSQSDFEQYAELCVLILSRPLPESIPFPAAAHSFFLRVFERVAQDPNVGTLKAVYCMLDGACQQVFDFLPSNIRQEFDRQLRLILSSNNTGENSMLLLWCFGIVLLAEHHDRIEGILSPHARSENLGSSDFPTRLWKTSSGQRLFGSTKASYKTITLTCMSVVWATKGDVGVPVEEAVQAIRIASKTLRVVDQHVRESWPKSSDLAEKTFRKLSEKIKVAGISRHVLLEALCFHAMIAGLGNLQPEMVALYEHCLENISDIIDAEFLNETLSLSIPIFAPQMQESSIRAILTKILDACILIPSSHQLVTLKILVENLSTVIPNCESLCINMLSSLSENILQKKLWDIIRGTSTIEDITCHSYVVSQHRKLVSATIALSLTLSLAEGPKELKLPNGLAIALINKQRFVPSVENKCSHLMAAPKRPSISLFQQACTQYTGQHLQDWRSRLKSELASQGSYQRDLLVRSVAQICQDLETRCDTVEEPLRQERERTEQLEQQALSLQGRIYFLETERVDYKLHLEGVEEEKENLAHEKEELLAKFEESKLKLSEANKHAAETLHTVQEEFRIRDQDLRFTILRQEEKELLHSRKLEALNETLLQFKEAREQQEQDRRTLTEKCEQLQTQFNNTESLLRQERVDALEVAKKVTRLETQSFDLENQLQGVEEDLETTLRKLSALEVNHHELIQTSEEMLRETKTNHRNEMELAARKAEEERNELGIQLQTALQDGQRVKVFYEDAQRDLEHIRNYVPVLEAKLQELTDLCSEQEEELEELRTLRRNVLASFGLATQKPLASRSTSGIHNEDIESNSPQKPREHRQRKSAIQEQGAVPNPSLTIQDIPYTAMENTASASFASSDSQLSQSGGSTPKRLRPRQSFKGPAMRTPYTQKAMLKSTSTSNRLSPKKRAALTQTSPNRRHTTVGFAISVDEEEYRDTGAHSTRKRRGSLQQVDQEDFDMDELLTGTGKIPEDDEGATTEL